MKPCRHPARTAATTTRVSVSVDVEPHPTIEHLATNMLMSVLGEIAADGIRATNIAVTIDGYDPIHPWVP